jgi:hypothetical protein
VPPRRRRQALHRPSSGTRPARSFP